MLAEAMAEADETLALWGAAVPDPGLPCASRKPHTNHLLTLR